MTTMAWQELELIDQINRLDSNLKAYQKAQAHPPAWMDTNVLVLAIAQITAEINELESQLDALIFYSLTPAPILVSHLYLPYEGEALALHNQASETSL
jgi:hypothetical protein